MKNAQDATAKVIQVIQTSLSSRGDGTRDNHMRRITQYWSLDGELLAEVDPCELAGFSCHDDEPFFEEPK